VTPIACSTTTGSATAHGSTALRAAAVNRSAARDTRCTRARLVVRSATDRYPAGGSRPRHLHTGLAVGRESSDSFSYDDLTLVHVENLGNLGDFLGGVGAFLLFLIAVLNGPSAWGDWRSVQQAKKRHLDEQANQIRLDRERHHFGWRRGMHSVYRVRNVTDPDEINRAARELAIGGSSTYALVQVEDSVNRANDLRRWIDVDGYIAQPPTDVEYQALEKNSPSSHSR
jgi:hypothetical protein